MIARYGAAAMIAVALAAPAARSATLFATTGVETRGPAGWFEFCERVRSECSGRTPSRDVVLSRQSWTDLNNVNTTVNFKIKPMTDMDHWGVGEKWSYPDDGYGDCEDYALLKRRLLMELGWPRSALLMTIVIDETNQSHAVLTVKTDRGDYVLDNRDGDVRLWAETGYSFLERQSQTDPNVWLSIGGQKPDDSTTTRLDQKDHQS